MLVLRRHSPALSDGALTLITPLSDPKRVLAFARIHPRETARVHLNCSDRELPLDLRDAPGRRLHSNLRDTPEPATGVRRLAPWEAVVIFDTAELPT